MNVGLNEKGLFRVPGFMNQVKEMKQKYDAGTIWFRELVGEIGFDFGEESRRECGFE